ncbi:DinB family protein [Cesiribacter sp. SM1]|uniref:DinB family protein n=1 Tax=Cesiribacter sp. SM1 TaxID=2861196 RepID=UPI001CD1D68B|nr:DinB family protein [Cesiribacter sp. SM1]
MTMIQTPPVQTTAATTTLIDIFAKELEQEAVTTRKMLERIPDDKFSWQPHPKSMTIKRLATHIAELPTWIGMTLTTNELDFSNNPYAPVDVNTTAELLEYFEKSLEDGRKHIAMGRDEQLSDPWTLRDGDTIYDTSPKLAVLRMSFNQIVHHRAQLGVYLRLLNIPIPGSYGPSADEMDF